MRHPPSVLIVDDSGDCAETLELALHGIAGLAIAVVDSAEEALTFLAIRPVAALVSDLHLPKMEGLELVSRVRAQPGREQLPIIVVSGDSDPATPDRVLRAGANAFFAKPYSPAAVRRHLEELLSAENGRNNHGPTA